MVGSELASNVEYLLDRAAGELAVKSRLNPLAKRLAPIYIRLFGVPEIGLHVRTRAVLRALPADVGAFCDLGCGAGFLLGAIARSKTFSSISGIEIDAESAKLATQLHRTARVVTSDVRDVATSLDETFDTAASVDVLEHLDPDELLDFLRRARDLLKPSGTFVVHVPMPEQRRHFRAFKNWSHHDHEREGFTVEELIGVFSDTGFAVTNVERTTGYFGSLAWELNMRLAATPTQALAFPAFLLLASLDDIVKSARYNGVLITARRH